MLALATSIGILSGPSKVNANSEGRARGAELFAQSGCEHCHGPSGIGGTDSGPDLRNVRHRLKPEQIHAQIANGGKTMPKFGDQFSPAQIDDLVEYLRSKRKPAKIPR